MRIIFMGTPEFAVPSLRILVENGYNVVAVVTATDKHGGRGGKKLLQSAVKKYAQSQDIPVLQPKNLKSKEFQLKLAEFNPDVQIIVAFRMLPESVWNMPSKGSINLHGSLLPAYRGAAPINWAIINGETETGLTTFQLKHQIDTGNIIFQEKVQITETDTAGTLHDKMMLVGAELILKTIKSLENETSPSIPQPDIAPTKAPKIYHDTCEIDFSQNVQTVYDFIRGLSPYPTAWTTIQGKKLKVYFAEKIKVSHNMQAGKWITDNKKYLKFTCKDGLISIKDCQLSGRRRMDISSLLNGYQLE